jgi:hypothetical protein
MIETKSHRTFYLLATASPFNLSSRAETKMRQSAVAHCRIMQMNSPFKGDRFG